MTSSPRKLLMSALLPAGLALVLGACAPKPAEPATTAAAAPEPAAAPDTPEAAAAPTEAEAADGITEDAIVTPLPAGADSPAADAAAPDLIAECNGDAVQSLVGQKATEALLEQAKTGSGARTVRALKPGQPATMDFRPDRLSIALDENDIIQALHCG